MPSTDWSDWTSSLSGIARAGIYPESDVERMRDQLRGYSTNVRQSISDGMSSVQRELASSYGDGYSGSTVFTSTSSTSAVPVALVAGLVVGGVGLLIFFIVLCCVCCKHKSGGRVIQAPSAATALSPAASAPHERHNPLSYVAPPAGGTALYAMPPGQAAYPGPALAPYAAGPAAAAADLPPAYDSNRPLLPAAAGAAGIL